MKTIFIWKGELRMRFVQCWKHQFGKQSWDWIVWGQIIVDWENQFSTCVHNPKSTIELGMNTRHSGLELQQKHIWTAIMYAFFLFDVLVSEQNG